MAISLSIKSTKSPLVEVFTCCTYCANLNILWTQIVICMYCKTKSSRYKLKSNLQFEMAISFEVCGLCFGLLSDWSLHKYSQSSSDSHSNCKASGSWDCFCSHGSWQQRRVVQGNSGLLYQKEGSMVFSSLIRWENPWHFIIDRHMISAHINTYTCQTLKCYLQSLDFTSDQAPVNM